MKRFSLIAIALAVGVSSSACSKEEPSAKKADPAVVKNKPTTEPAKPESKLLTAGTAAPDIETVAHDGTSIKMSALVGSPVVLYFYPKDETPG